MDLQLEGKVALITGGSRGIGKSTAMALAREGVDVALCSRNQAEAEATAKEIEAATGRKVMGLAADTTSMESVSSMVQTVVDGLGRIDILVNNAALPGGLVGGGIENASDTDLLADIDTKVVGYVRCAKAVTPHMKKQGWGRIINIGGLAARGAGTISGVRNIALVHLTKTLSAELGPFGINVNVVHPGATITERSDPMYEEQAKQRGVSVDDVMEGVAQGMAIRKIVTSDEVADVVTFLASPRAISITGEAIAAGGGVGTAVHS